ncbi:zinc-dependent alcohol dehydrogenase family protein [Gordonia rhizosphera]|uniref:Putative zinc-containing alcohol dehydrogenase n=1 Tax=Gordonia rhizosphera NBRC 16068 TaxID=1108045 RepID=K6W060_9ACTN|nr:zinc-binding dehydrogenase [Gordonia rhizosphera]GAB92550.1 putative zinc-containing alcohol dehydrogenase [Gordonia rhizosphera NBRC 16068]
MRGVVFKGDRELEVTDFPDPTPGPDDVVIEIKASGLCGSDLKFYRDPPGAALKALGFKDFASRGMDENPAIIAGHEPCGVVAEIGSNVNPQSFTPGDRVMVFHYDGCGYCDLCRTGWTQMCEQGATIYGATAHGGHATYMVVPARTLVHMPEGISFSAGAAIACGTGTAFGALKRADVTGRDTVAVFGLGPIGQSTIQFATAMGAEVIAVDIAADRVAAAKELGAHHVIDSSVSDPIEAIREITGGKGASVAIETSGAPVARAAATRALGVWGRIALVGLGGNIDLDVSPDIVIKQISIIGSYTFSNVGMGECARFVAAHDIDVDAVFTDRWNIEDADQAYKEFDKQTRGKAVIEF